MASQRKTEAVTVCAVALVSAVLAISASASGPAPALRAQDLQHAVSVVNIEVPVRVFRGDDFVEGLGLGDFEVFEDGKPQRIEAVYLIKKTGIEKKEEKEKAYAPDVSRHFFLVFELHEYMPRVGQATDLFFEQIIAPGDRLYVATPVKTYHFKEEAFTRLTRKRMAEQMKDLLKTDLTLGNSEHRSMMKSLTDIFAMDVEPDLKHSLYMSAARTLRDHKYIEEDRLRAFADLLKDMEGQKHVFLFYQKELIPILPGLDDFSIAELSKDISFDATKVKRAFSDSSITVHFLFVTDKPGMHDNLDVGRGNPLRVELLDQSDNIFGAFRDVARATGGIADSSANPLASFRKAVTASENYYLVYYSPSDRRADGQFRRIEVRVKGRGLRVTHREGYYAD
jgi:VWFA-related protein